MSKPKIVDLELGDDGTYGAKSTKTKAIAKKKESVPYRDKSKNVVPSGADEFLSGIDIGLDFIDKFVPRIDRFLKLRG